MKKVLILALILTKTTLVIAQQVPTVSYFMYDYGRTNPGSMGHTDMICANAITKQQWVGMPGAPLTYYVNASAPFNLFGAKHGVGLSFVGDQWGFYNDIDLKINYAYRFTIGDGNLGIGLSGGFIQKNLKPDWKNVDPEIESKLPQGDENVIKFNLGAGIFYNTEDIYFGVSVVNLYAPEIEYETIGGEGATTSEPLTEKLTPHLFATAGYNMQLSNPAFEIKPAVQVYTDLGIVNLDINARVVYNKNVWGGVSYRVGSSVVGMIGFTILDGVEVGYAYDFQTSALTNESSGSHEIMLNYCFQIGVQREPQKYRSIRFL